MKLEDLKVYNVAMEIGEEVWMIVDNWNLFRRMTVGTQFVRAADSVAANISEGYDRYHFKESKQFYYYARGSLFETRTWLKKASNRKLVDYEKYNAIDSKINDLLVRLNNFINKIGQYQNRLQEPDNEIYGDNSLI